MIIRLKPNTNLSTGGAEFELRLMSPGVRSACLLSRTLLFLVGAIIIAAALNSHGGTETSTVSPGKTEVVNFAEDPTGIYQLNIEATSGHTIKDSDFTAEFKGSTLWQRNSKTSYNITYIENPKPPGVSVEGDFERSGGGGGGYSPNHFLVNVPNVDCEPEDRELDVSRHVAPLINEGNQLVIGAFLARAAWNNPEGCECNVTICRNTKGAASVKFSDGSSLGINMNSYLLDSDYPGADLPVQTAPSGKKFVRHSDNPALRSSPAVLAKLTEKSVTANVEEFFMVIPEQGPALSLMIVSWYSTATAKMVSGSLTLYSTSSDPDSGIKSGFSSDRPPVSSGMKANEFGTKYWKVTAGSSSSDAANFLTLYNTSQ